MRIYTSASISASGKKKSFPATWRKPDIPRLIIRQDSEKLNIREEEETTYSPNFKLTLEYTLTDEGLEVTIPNASIQYDKKHFTLISIQLLEYFGADKPGDASDGYVFLPDGSGSAVVHEQSG